MSNFALQGVCKMAGLSVIAPVSKDKGLRQILLTFATSQTPGSLAAIKMKFYFTVILLVSFSSYGQNITFREIKLKPNPIYYKTAEKTIIYPIVVTNNKRVDSLINPQIKNEVFSPDDEKQSIYKTLVENIDDYGLINLSYEVTYKGSGLLSFSIFSEGCGAYCSSGETYFNFDLKTGKKLSITDLITETKLDSFHKLVFANKVKSLIEYKEEELNIIKQVDIDSTTYDWALEQVDSYCINDVKLDDFSLSRFNLEIKDICEFPHGIRSQLPTYELRYTYVFLSTFLTPRFKKIFLK